MKKIFTLFLAWLICNTTCKAQMVTLGTEFFISLEAPGTAGLSMVSHYPATVFIHFFDNPDLDTTVILIPDVITEFTLDYFTTSSMADHIPGEIDHKSAVICSDLPINVSFGDVSIIADDVSVVYPVLQPEIVDELYYMNTVGSDEMVLRRAGLIIAHFDEVTVEIIPKIAFAGHGADVPFQVTLNRGETYSISHSSLDESGSTIRVISAPFNHALTVYSSTDITYSGFPWDVPGRCCADATLEQMLPVTALDTVYQFVPFLIAAELGGPPLPGILRVVSAADDNIIRLDGIPVASLNAGDVYDTLLYEPAVVTSDGKISVCQFMQSASCSEMLQYGDPDQLWLTPLKNGIQESYFKVWDYLSIADTGLLATITIIAEAGNDDIKLDEVNISGDFLLFPGDDHYKYLQLLIQPNHQYHLVSPEKVAAYNSILYEFGGITYALSDIASGMIAQSDTMYICDTTTLTGVSGMSSYLWSTGATTAAIKVSEGGTYWVQGNIGCSNITDTFHVLTAAMPDLLPADTFLCGGTSLLLNAYQDYFTAYSWNTGATTPSITVSAAGSYTVTAYTEYCDGLSDTFNIYIPAPPLAVLPEDTLLCKGIPLSLEVDQDSVAYRWSTGQTDCCIKADSSGLYWVEVTNPCRETTSDSVQVLFTGCTDCLLAPNAFSPNNDGLNDMFTVQTACMFSSYCLAIFNRYGQRLFISYDPEKGWDGTYNGLPADVGVYFYQVEAAHFIRAAGSFRKQGDLTLIR